jgi:hypothetical protein
MNAIFSASNQVRFLAHGTEHGRGEECRWAAAVSVADEL